MKYAIFVLFLILCLFWKFFLDTIMILLAIFIIVFAHILAVIAYIGTGIICCYICTYPFIIVFRVLEKIIK